ncbi:MAG: bifunctional DNA-binding transcriptional regulator/O6-methylguanine-DNA methyltransferase Ada [Chloroflexota bacterium]
MEDLMALNLEEQRWQAVQQREMGKLTPFVYGVKTTGVYCRPTCPSKTPRRENVRFFDTAQQAQEAGFRPCKRCRPDDEVDGLLQIVKRACEMIAQSPAEVSLKELAKQAGFSPSYFQRLFKRTVGVTPKQYALQWQRQRLREGLQTQSSVTQAAMQAGSGGLRRLYGGERRRLGMRPRQYQQGGSGARIRYAMARCELGWVAMAATEQGVCAVEFGDSAAELEGRLREVFPQAEELSGDPQLSAWLEELIQSIEAPTVSPQIPLDIRGSAFQVRVWQAIQRIPAGETATYGEIAQQLGKPGAARAVGQACAKNPAAVVIPCHRVVGAGGGLGGYRWGRERKKKLLEREAEGA